MITAITPQTGKYIVQYICTVHRSLTHSPSVTLAISIFVLQIPLWPVFIIFFHKFNFSTRLFLLWNFVWKLAGMINKIS